MKTVKKTGWQYRFLIWTFQYEPKNLCALYLYTLAAFILCPLVLFENYINYFLGFVGFVENDGSVRMNKNHSEVWTDKGLGFVVNFIFSLFTILAAVGILCLFGQKEMNTVSAIFVFSAPITFLPLFTGIRKVYKIGKEKFCKPITYIE